MSLCLRVCVRESIDESVTSHPRAFQNGWSCHISTLDLVMSLMVSNFICLN